MKNLCLTSALVAALAGTVSAVPAPLDARAVVWKEVIVTVTKTVTAPPGWVPPTGQPEPPAQDPPHAQPQAQGPANIPAPHGPVVVPSAPAAAAPKPQPAPPAPKPAPQPVAPAPVPAPAPPTTPSVAPAPPTGGSSGSGSSNSCPLFPGMTNPLQGATESYCCTAAKPCGIADDAGAEATFYSMAGGTGACGKSLPDSAMFVAVNAQIMGSLSSGNPANPLCGKTVTVKNTKTGKTATGTVQDKCPGCKTGYGIDLSPGVFNQLADASAGVFPVAWWFTDL